MANITGPIEKCQKCGGPLYDNRQSKISPKSPDFKCKDQTCGEAYWIGTPKAAGGGGSYGRGRGGQPPWSSWAEVQSTYWRCLSIAKVQVEKALKDATAADIVAAAATIWISVGNRGVKPAAPPPQPLEEKPKAVQEAEDFADEFDKPYSDYR